MNKKELNREEFYRQYSYDRKHRALALRQLITEESELCIVYDEKDFHDTIHQNNCRQEYQRNNNLLRRLYISFKGRQLCWKRQCSPDYHFAEIVEKKIQFKVDTTRLKQEILKGKSYTSNMIK